MGAADEEESEDELEGLDLLNKKNAQVQISHLSQRAVMTPYISPGFSFAGAGASSCFARGDGNVDVDYMN
jgi:hypothetical protein